MKFSDYTIGKGKVAEYIAKMDATYKELLDLTKAFDNAIIEDKPEFEWFDYNKSIKFLHTWEIMKEINVAQRNLLCAYEACNHSLDDCLTFFNGKGKNIKNKASLSVLISNARKAVTTKYIELYGTD